MSPSHIEALTVIAGLLYNFTYVKMKRPNKNPLKRKRNASVVNFEHTSENGMCVAPIGI